MANPYSAEDLEDLEFVRGKRKDLLKHQLRDGLNNLQDPLLYVTILKDLERGVHTKATLALRAKSDEQAVDNTAVVAALLKAISTNNARLDTPVPMTLPELPRDEDYETVPGELDTEVESLTPDDIKV